MKTVEVKLTLEGEIEVYSQEGGYCAPQVSVGKECLTHAIQDLLEVHRKTKMLGSREVICSDIQPPGKWRVTLERIET